MRGTLLLPIDCSIRRPSAAPALQQGEQGAAVRRCSRGLLEAVSL
ncbi:hypothetical protein GCWU000341_00283 [Oribacterium sp. oral taxon 078 str. F0262]|nr:hypothetical protein GCWU000341_00283 [Oribacterium sp. oral taxon 078 str. F0262]